MKSYTDIEQSRKLAEIIPMESADYCWGIDDETLHYNNSPYPCAWKDYTCKEYYIPCWSLTALLKFLSEIKPQVYTPILFPSEGKWMLQFTEYGHGTVCEVSYDNPVDACVAMIIKLNELNLL